MLTKQQARLLDYIVTYSERGVSPSFEEMKAHLGLKSKSGIHRLVRGLEERGCLRVRHHRARAIEVIRIPGKNDVMIGDGLPRASILCRLIDDLIARTEHPEGRSALWRLRSLIPETPA